MAVRRKKVFDQVQRVLGRFNLEEFIHAVLPEFQEITWDEIKAKIVKEKLQLSAKSAKMILANHMKDWHKEDLELKFYDLLILDIAYHSKQRIWHTFELQGDPPRTVEWPDLERSFTQACRRNKMECVVRVMVLNDLIWMMAMERKLTRHHGVVMMKPVYCARYYEEPYLFMSPPRADMVKTMAQTFHYDSGTPVPLQGPYIESLFRILKNKLAGASLATPFTPDPPTITDGAIDYTGLTKLQQYSRDFFDPNPPLITQLQVKDKEKKWRGTKTIPKMQDKKFESYIVFKSSNVLQMFKELIELGVITPDLPPYILKFTEIGQTTLNAQGN